MEFKRQITNRLEEWKNSPSRKPLILRGARQVGKTTLVKEFSLNYAQSILLNLEKSADRTLFETYDDIKTIVESLLIIHNITVDKLDNTLLFIDEIQESPKTIQLLRYFYEDYPQLHVIAAGSLLEFAMRQVQNFPVGRITYLYMHPLNFGEYLEATNQQAALEQLSVIPIKPHIHTILLDLFNRYAIIGGMPEVVKTLIEEDSITGLTKVYEGIWETYQNDVEKYASNETERKVIKYIISTAYLYLDQRIKYQNFGNSSYRSREVGEALKNLNDARIIQLIHPTTDTEIPIKPDIKKSPRLQFLDTGLVNYKLGIQGQMIGLKDLDSAFKGAIIPHLVTQELISLNQIKNDKPHFWVREKKQASSEVDLVYTYLDKVIPIEIKSGSTGSLKSLHQFVERTNHSYAVRIYSGEFKIENAVTPGGVPYLLMNLPYYLGTKIEEYITHFVSNYKLEKTQL